MTGTDIPQKPVRVALVGCGAVTLSSHIPALRAVGGVETTVFCDRNEASAVEARRLMGAAPTARVVSSPREVVGLADAAIVAVPPRLHAPVSVELMRGGLDVLCEKPIAASTAEAELMVGTAAAQQRVLAVGFMQRFCANNALFQSVLQSGFLGDIQRVGLESGVIFEWGMTTDSFFNKASTLGGVFYDFGIHGLDRFLSLVGTPEDIEYEDDSFGGVESNALLHANVKIGGRTVPCEMAFSWTHALPARIYVSGSRASVELPLSDPDSVVMDIPFAGKPVRWFAKTPTENLFLLQIRDFLAAVRTRRPPLVTAESALGSLAVIERAYRVRRPLRMSWVEAIQPA